MLSPRLQIVASFVSKGAVLADIGSDHAYVPCVLVLDKTIDKAYACEVKEGPLASSQRTIRNYQLETQVTTVLSDGLQEVPDDVNEVVIAGMGVHTVLSILQDGMARLPHFNRIIVQANHSVELLREFLSSHAFRIVDEELVYDDGKYYEVVVFRASQGTTLTKEETYFGPCLLRKNSALFQTYYQSRYDTLQQIASKLSPQHERYHSVQDEIHLIASNVRIVDLR